MRKDGRYINAGTNEFYRWGRKAIEKISAGIEPNKAGYLSIPADGGKYYTFGTSEGKFGEYARIGDTCFSVNSAGSVYAKAGTEKGDKLIAGLNALIAAMNAKHEEMSGNDEEDIEDDLRNKEVIA